MVRRGADYVPLAGSMFHKIVRQLLDGPLTYRDLRQRILEEDGRPPVRTYLSVSLNQLKDRGLVFRKDPKTLQIVTEPRVQNQNLLWDLSPEFRKRCRIHFAKEDDSSGGLETLEEEEEIPIEKPENMSDEIFVEMMGIREAARRITAITGGLVQTSAFQIVEAVDRILGVSPL